MRSIPLPPPSNFNPQGHSGRRKGPTNRASLPSGNAISRDASPRSIFAFPQTTGVSWAKDRRIEAAIALIENGLETGVRIPKLAASVGLSRFRLEHLFRAQVGVPIRAYVEARRLVKAKAMLHDMRLRVKEVAARCGYASGSSLTREFKHRLGLSPSEYRHSTSG